MWKANHHGREWRNRNLVGKTSGCFYLRFCDWLFVFFLPYSMRFHIQFIDRASAKKRGTVIACLSRPRCPSPMAENRHFASEKAAFKKAERPVNGPERPSTGLNPLLGIYTHGRQKASKLAIFRGVPFRDDRTGQFWTNLDNSRHCNSGDSHRHEWAISNVKCEMWNCCASSHVNC